MNLAAGKLSTEQQIEYLRTLPAIRERCGRVHDRAKNDGLEYFTYHPDKEVDVADYCTRIIKVCRLGTVLLHDHKASMGSVILVTIYRR
jgi:hypothetical protein